MGRRRRRPPTGEPAAGALTGGGARAAGTGLALAALALAWTAGPASGAPGPLAPPGLEEGSRPGPGSGGGAACWRPPAHLRSSAAPTGTPAADLHRPSPPRTADRARPGARVGTAPVLEAGPPEYYAFPLVSTGRIPGTARARGTGQVIFPSASPFGVAVSGNGSYRYELHLSVDGLPDAGARRYVVWITTPSVDRIRRVGSVSADGRIRGSVSWNKFLVVVTLEPAPAASPAGGDADAGWSGPIVLRGMSRSGMMHTMAGHGPFEQENCAAYGYD